jgi:hypothetical protein
MNISKAAGSRICKAVMTGDGTSAIGAWSLTYTKLLEIMRAEKLRAMHIPGLMNYLAEEKGVWALKAVADVCAFEARENRAILQHLYAANRDLNDKFGDDNE